MVRRQPTLSDKKQFSSNIYAISSEDLGKVVQLLDQRCDVCIRKIDADDIEVDIDAIDPVTFWMVDDFVKQCIGPSGRGRGKKRKAESPAAGGGKAKKSRVG